MRACVTFMTAYRHEKHRRTQITVAHGNRSGPIDPVLQVQFVKAALPAGEWEFVGQSVHVEVGTPSNSISPSTIQEATKPDETTLPSEVNTTCMYPVLDV